MNGLKSFLEGLLNKSNKTNVVGGFDMLKEYLQNASADKTNDDEFQNVLDFIESEYKELHGDIIKFTKQGMGYITFRDSVLGQALEFYLFEKTTQKTVYRTRFSWYQRQGRLLGNVDVAYNGEAGGKIGKFHNAEDWEFEGVDKIFEVPKRDMVEMIKVVVSGKNMPTYFSKPAVKYLTKLIS